MIPARPVAISVRVEDIHKNERRITEPRLPCEECGKSSWVMPDQLTKLRAHGVPICTACLIRMVGG